MKALFISIMIVAIIFTIGILTQKHLEETSDEMIGKLNELKQEVEKNKEKTTKAEKLAKETYDKWKQIEHSWTMLIAHAEIDLIETSLLATKSTIETKQIEESIKELNQSIFLIEHIKEKEKIKLRNIF